MHLLKLGILIAAAAAAVLTPISYVESGPTICLFKLTTGHDCPGCGMTRAVSAALHGQFERAWRYNPRFVAVLPVLGWLWCRQVLREVRGLRAARRRAAPSEGAPR